MNVTGYGSVCQCLPPLYLNEGSDEAGIANCTSIEIDGLHDRDVFTKRYIDNASMADFWLSAQTFCLTTEMRRCP